ncbi:MAG: hypothetical protein ACI379_00085 [Nocardioides sp.]|uniref:hypothetical protein n=1 Tax=Nocardioides sp. TaxID=35761 RepID=UPI003F10D7CB
MPMMSATAPDDVPTASPVAALREFLALVQSAPRPAEAGAWRWGVRRQMVVLRDALLTRPASASDGWLASRGAVIAREGEQLVERMRSLGRDVLEVDDLSPLRRELFRLATDIGHHLQRRSDLAWDAVEQEYGGSE